MTDPIEAIQTMMQMRGLSLVDMQDVFGSRSRAWEIMNKRRRLPLSMIRKLHKDYGIPASTLISEYPLTP